MKVNKDRFIKQKYKTISNDVERVFGKLNSHIKNFSFYIYIPQSLEMKIIEQGTLKY